ncbi:hypothetical protein NLN82_25415, partial [Citrobacter portucalensis]|uniref:hypothetical protein n=1 Tax=Citrobacter portucalensis TaxID=1639133 RepID=UPI00226B324E
DNYFQAFEFRLSSLIELLDSMPAPDSANENSAKVKEMIIQLQREFDKKFPGNNIVDINW